MVKWQVSSAAFSAQKHAMGGVVRLTFSVEDGTVNSFTTDSKGNNSNQHSTSWGSRN